MVFERITCPEVRICNPRLTVMRRVEAQKGLRNLQKKKKIPPESKKSMVLSNEK